MMTQQWLEHVWIRRNEEIEARDGTDRSETDPGA